MDITLPFKPWILQISLTLTLIPLSQTWASLQLHYPRFSHEQILAMFQHHDHYLFNKERPNPQFLNHSTT